MDNIENRKFFHSFPRPKAGEHENATLKRGLSILSSMKDIGLLLAPEIVEWNVNPVSGGIEQLKLLQRRASFTELSANELVPHSKIFGPITLALDIMKLRQVGAMPVIYSPQCIEDNPLSRMATFCVRGAYHTSCVLRQLQGLKEHSDTGFVAKKTGLPVSPEYKLQLQNTDATGKVVAHYDVPAIYVQNVLQHVGFNNIPFDHSIGVLAVFMNMFYPTDNTHSGEQHGYYRQREWRLIAGDIQYNGRQLGRKLTNVEAEAIKQIDQEFWAKELQIDGKLETRIYLALAQANSLILSVPDRCVAALV